MARKVTLAIAAVALMAGTVTAIPAQAATKVSNGVACSKVNATTKVGGYSYKCAKNTMVKNSKLTWLSVECLSAIKSFNAAVVARKNLSDASAQIAALDAEITTANAALVNTTTALTNAKDQLIKTRETMNASTNPTEKLKLSDAVTKLANAILVLTTSRSKLDSQVRDLAQKKALLANAPAQLAMNVSDTRSNANLLCAKGF